MELKAKDKIIVAILVVLAVIIQKKKSHIST